MYINGDDEIKEEEEMDEDAVSLDDDLLAEVGEEEEVEDEMEGFGLIDETAEVEKAEEEEEDAEGDTALEDDAEDVEYDSFDDVDEL